MNNHKLPWYLRIVYILLILLCIALTSSTVIKYTKIESVPALTSKTDDETLRGEAILEQYEQKTKVKP